MQATCNGLKGNLGDIVDINQLSCYLILNGKSKKRSKDKGEKGKRIRGLREGTENYGINT